MSGGSIRRAAIIAVGSELLTPLRTDTNSLLITTQLNALGIEVGFKCVVGDDRVELAEMVRHAMARVDLLVLCGGLGPTDDDVTREVVAATLGRALHERVDISDAIRQRFASRGLEMPAINRRQAMVPEGAEVLTNSMGTAPGLWMDADGKSVLLLPGPPRELGPMLTRVAEEQLKARAGGEALSRRTIRITGLSESHAEEAVQPLYRDWAREHVPVSATILAALGQVELHLSARAGDRRSVEHVLDRATERVCAVLGRDVYSTDGRTLEEVVGALLAARGWWISVAESCTGGLITCRLTDVPGSSRYLDRGVVSYSNDAKTQLLDVPPALIAGHGAVSEEVALSMAAGARARSGSDVGVGVTGIAGPQGGSPGKPVGTVVVAVVTPTASRVRTLRLLGERALVKFQASQAALDLVRRMLEGD